MEKDYFISMWLDARRPKENGKFPVKLRVFTPHPRTQKLYSTEFEFTKSEFQSIWQTLKPREAHKEIRNKMRAIELKATKIAEGIIPFSFIQFERALFRNDGEGTNAVYQYNQTIEKLKASHNFGTASNYQLSLKSLLAFEEFRKGKPPAKLPLSEITTEWLNKYEDYMIKTLGRSRTTVGIYLRPLRAIFNTAISEKEIPAELYPFGTKKYQIPTVRNVKKALSQADLKKLFKAKSAIPEQIKAKDFWFLSYACNGMNIKDIAQLRYENIQEDKIIFYRAKTINTSKSDLRPVTVYLNDFSKSIIKKYGNKNTGKKEYVFAILSVEDDEVTKHNKVKNFTRFINQNLKKLAKDQEITSEISTYWARHSFATNSIRSGASMEFVMEALNHSNMKTTVGYFAGFEDKDKKEFMQKLMKF